jgi:hypothetical protein
MADDTGQVGQVRWRYAPSRLLRLLTLTTNCHLVQDVLLYFATVYRPFPDVILVAGFSLSLAASPHGVLCRVVRWWQSPSWHLRQATTVVIPLLV